MPDTEITRAETRERARSLLVRSYDADWTLSNHPQVDVERTLDDSKVRD